MVNLGSCRADLPGHLKENIWSLSGVAIILACSIYQKNGSALGAAVVISFIAFLMRRKPEFSLILNDHTSKTLKWQVAVIISFVAIEQIWFWAGSPGMPKGPLWINAEWVDIAQPQSRIFTWQTVIREGVTLLVVILMLRVFSSKPRELGLTDIRPSWRWTGPLLFLGLYGGVAFVALAANLYGHAQFNHFHIGAVGTAMAIAFFGAGLIEELIYRLLLQTRLEALLGRWNGIFIAGMIFGIVHVRGTYQVMGGVLDHPLDLQILSHAVASCVLQQGVGGIIYGYMWSRFRNGWMMVAHHGTMDSLSLVILTLVRGIQLG